MFSVSIIGYEILAVVISMIKYKNRKQEKIITILLMFSFSILMAFRSEKLPDISWYTAVFEDIRTNFNYGFSLIKHHYIYDVEYGFVWLMVLFKTFVSQNIHAFYFFISSVSSIFFLLSSIMAIKYFNESSLKKIEINLPMLFCIYSSYYGLYYCGIAIRGALAIPLILMAILCFIRKKFVLSFFCCLLGMTMHRLTLVMLIDLIIVFMPKIKKGIVLFLWIIMGISMILKVTNQLIPISIQIMTCLTGKISSLEYGQYINNQSFALIPKAFIWIWIIGAGLIVFCYNYKEIYKYIYIYVFGFIVILFAGNMNGISRVYDMFTVSYIPILCEYYDNNLGVKGIKKAVIFAVVLINTILVINIYGWV
jgi:hypothetical protein